MYEKNLNELVQFTLLKSFKPVLKIHFFLMRIRILDPPLQKWIRIFIQNMNISYCFDDFYNK